LVRSKIKFCFLPFQTFFFVLPVGSKIISPNVCFLYTGTKTAVAKAKPRPKTFVSALAKLAGTSESSLKSLLWGVLALIVMAAVILTIYD